MRQPLIQAPHPPRGALTSPFFIPALAGLAFVACFIAWRELTFALQSLESVRHDRVGALADLHETSAPIYRVLPALTELGHPIVMDSAATALKTAREASVKAWKLYLGTILTETEVALVNQTTGPVASLHKVSDDLIQILQKGDRERLVAHMNDKFLPSLGEVADRMEALVALQRTVTEQWVAKARRRHQVARGFLIATGVLAAALASWAMTSSWRLRRSL